MIYLCIFDTYTLVCDCVGIAHVFSRLTVSASNIRPT